MPQRGKTKVYVYCGRVNVASCYIYGVIVRAQCTYINVSTYKHIYTCVLVYIICKRMMDEWIIYLYIWIYQVHPVDADRCKLLYVMVTHGLIQTAVEYIICGVTGGEKSVNAGDVCGNLEFRGRTVRETLRSQLIMRTGWLFPQKSTLYSYCRPYSRASM